MKHAQVQWSPVPIFNPWTSHPRPHAVSFRSLLPLPPASECVCAVRMKRARDESPSSSSEAAEPADFSLDRSAEIFYEDDQASSPLQQQHTARSRR